MEKLLILGAGGHGKVVLECAMLTGKYDEISFLDDGKEGQEIGGCQVIGPFSEAKKLKGEYNKAFVAVGDNHLRLKLMGELSKLGYNLPILIHPAAMISDFCSIREGTVILAEAVVNTGAEIGRGVIINTGAIIEHDCWIGDGVHLSPGSRLGGQVQVGDTSWLCIGSVVINRISIGKDCQIAAGAVVINDVSDGVKVYGVPAREKGGQAIAGKKVLILTNHDVGLYKFRKELIQTLLSQGAKVYLGLPGGEYISEFQKMGCRFLPVEMDRRGINPVEDIKLCQSYQRIFKEVKPDEVITYTIKPNIYGGMICRLKHIPYFANITGLGTGFQKEGPLKQLIIHMYKLALGKAGCVFFENEGNKNVFRFYSIVKEEEKAVVMNGAGVNLKEYPFTPMPSGEKEIRFLFVGRIMKEKGVDELFEAAKKIKKRYKEVQFDVVGPFEDAYEERINSLVKAKIINYYNYQKDIRPFIAKAHCLVLPSYHEGMSNVLLEAAAMGRPLITSGISGCQEAVKGNGYLVKPKDETDLYQKIEKFIKLPAKERMAKAVASRKLMEASFDREKVIRKTLAKMKKA